jgi:hypothetical protein
VRRSGFLLFLLHGTREARKAGPGLVADVSVEPEAPSKDVAWALEQGLPLKDAPILAAAVQARCDVLVTGDRTHFGPLSGRRLRGVQVLSPADALRLLLR